MRQLGFGQPVGGIIQSAYVVEDIYASMRDFTARLGVGPWFVSDPFQPPEGRHRGEPTTFTITLAIAFTGHHMVELIQQHDQNPSVYVETVKGRGYGFHHWAIGSDNFEADVDRYKLAGFVVAFSDRSPRGMRVAYMDKPGELPGMIEIVEMTEAAEAAYTRCFEAAQGWDGKDPFRTFDGRQVRSSAHSAREGKPR
jgi:hypothetical protein